MDSPRPADSGPSPEAAAFVRFCYHRRRAGWPELYDEMCAVASRRLYNGWGFMELADHGIGFSLFETPTLALLAREIVRDETERRARSQARRAADRVEDAVVAADAAGAESSERHDRPDRPETGPVTGLGLAGAAIG
jgi:hypothetical protein